MITGHVINSSSCRNYSTSSVPHPSTILRGRCLTSVTGKTFAKLPCDIKLNKSNIQLYGYSSKVKIKVLGRYRNDRNKKRIAVAGFVVVAGNNGSLITAETAVALNLIQFTNKLTSKDSMFKDIIFNEYNDVFTGIGKLKNFKAELHIDENVIAKNSAILTNTLTNSR